MYAIDAPMASEIRLLARVFCYSRFLGSVLVRHVDVPTCVSRRIKRKKPRIDSLNPLLDIPASVDLRRSPSTQNRCITRFLAPVILFKAFILAACHALLDKMALTPGILFLLAITPNLLLPLCLHIALRYVANNYYSFHFYRPVIVLVWLVTLPVCWYIKASYAHLLHARKARRVGAKLVPQLSGVILFTLIMVNPYRVSFVLQRQVAWQYRPPLEVLRPRYLPGRWYRSSNRRVWHNIFDDDLRRLQGGHSESQKYEADPGDQVRQL